MTSQRAASDVGTESEPDSAPGSSSARPGSSLAGPGSPSRMPSRRGSSLREQAYESIKHDILVGDLIPGSPISEAERAERLGISRTPVREALMALAQDGLVEVFPKRGTFVARLSARDVRESFELREAIETACARLAAERRTEQDIEMMRAALHGEPVPSLDTSYVRAADFHGLIVRAAQNRYLTQAFDGTASRIDLASRLAARIEAHNPPDSTHRAVLEAIVRGDGEAAAEAMRRHIRGHAEALLANLR